MRKFAFIFAVAFIMGILLTGISLAKAGDVEETTVIIEINDNKELAKYKGLLVRVNKKENKFFSHSFFISVDDLKKLAKLRKAPIAINLKDKKLKLGKKDLEMVKINLDQKGYLFNKVRYMKYKGKYYFDTWGIYPGLGFSSVSRMSKGVYFYDPKLDKKKKSK